MVLMDLAMLVMTTVYMTKYCILVSHFMHEDVITWLRQSRPDLTMESGSLSYFQIYS